MAITAEVLLEKVSKTLLDETNVRWPITTEMLGWLDTGQRTACLLKPDLLTATTAVKLEAGTKQTLPAEGLSLIDITRNMGTDGTTPGNAITHIPREVLDTTLPAWHTSATASATAKHFSYDPRNPKVFYIYPAQPASDQGYVEEAYSTAPTTIALTTTPISLDDIYEGVLIDYCLYRAYAKDSQHTFNAERANTYRQSFLDQLGIRGQIETSIEPPKVVPKAQ